MRTEARSRMRVGLALVALTTALALVPSRTATADADGWPPPVIVTPNTPDLEHGARLSVTFTSPAGCAVRLYDEIQGPSAPPGPEFFGSRTTRIWGLDGSTFAFAKVTVAPAGPAVTIRLDVSAASLPRATPGGSTWGWNGDAWLDGTHAWALLWGDRTGTSGCATNSWFIWTPFRLLAP